jgi:hypothetical protein
MPTLILQIFGFIIICLTRSEMQYCGMLEDAVSRDLTIVQLEALGDEIATFAARIDVAEHALITRLRAFDAHEARPGSKHAQSG